MVILIIGKVQCAEILLGGSNKIVHVVMSVIPQRFMLYYKALPFQFSKPSLSLTNESFCL
jgi:hypothetical protein